MLFEAGIWHPALLSFSLQVAAEVAALLDGLRFQISATWRGSWPIECPSSIAPCFEALFAIRFSTWSTWWLWCNRDITKNWVYFSSVSQSRNQALWTWKGVCRSLCIIAQSRPLLFHLMKSSRSRCKEAQSNWRQDGNWLCLQGIRQERFKYQTTDKVRNRLIKL